MRRLALLALLAAGCGKPTPTDPEPVPVNRKFIDDQPGGKGRVLPKPDSN